ncbi:SRPBCC family protein [Amycolatopsis aidingensis]|uniref:SRPBCC family protein n=1 Tax=Amycolatopsis aidingensis TaxID=2842453 RepID=UPI001C0BA857|nr:SRPBCC family protein [Amycolatopsis aidingensis]
MQLEHEFTVPAGIDEVWRAVLDPERVAPCMPGATLAEADGDTFRGTVKVKLGPVSLLYKGSGEFVEQDEQARKVVITASGKDARGAGTAKATVTVTLTGDGGSTKGSVVTDLSVTGKPAQFGRGMIAEVGGKILDDFASCLGEKLGAASAQPEPETPAAEETTPPAAEERSDADVIDLFDYAGKSVAKRIVPVAAGVAVLLVLLAVIRRSRSR